jgi:urease accessory protein
LVAPTLCAAIGGSPEARAAGPSDNELQRAEGVVRIVLEGSERGTRIADVFQRYPLRVMFPRTSSSEVEGATHASHGLTREGNPGPTMSRRTPAQEGATHASHGLTREGNPGPTMSRRMPAQEGATHASHGLTREGNPGPTMSRRMPAQEGATHASHGLTREGNPGPTMSRRTPAQEEAVLVNASGGVAGGDRLEFAITALGNASAAVTSQAAEKVYRALSEAARISTRLKVSEAAKLAWLPQETIVFNRARLSRETEIDVVSGAELLALEWLVLGRAAHGEELAAGHLNDSWRVRIDGRLAWADSFRVTDGMFPRLRSRALLSSSKAIATLICFGPHLNRRLEFFRDQAPSPDCQFAATLVGGLLVARFAAERPSDLRRVLRTLLQEFDREFGPGPFRVPKMWSC